MAKQDLNVFLIKKDFTDFESIVEKDSVVKKYQIKEHWDFEGVILVGANFSNVPKWVSWLKEGAEGDINDIFNTSTRAVLLIRRQNRIFALPFGHGRHMLVKEAIVGDFGIRIVLNGLEPDGLRSIDTTKIGDITIHQRTQTSRQSSVNAFNIDVASSLLQMLTGRPKNEDYGARLTGREAIRFSREIEFGDLGELCDDLYSMYTSEDYKESFEWYDNLQSISDPELVSRLEQMFFDILEKGDCDGFHLAPPEIIEMKNIDGFSFTKKGVLYEDLSSEKYLEYFHSRDRDFESIKRQYVFVRNDEQVVYKWRLYDCIVFEVQDEDYTYILSGGSWFKVERDFSNLVNFYVAQIPDIDIDLPVCYSNEHEEAYNKRAANERGFLCLDRKIVRLDGGNIEVCDLLTSKNQLIHVKPWRSSSTLSHLFSQGRVSAESLLRDQAFREDTRKLIQAMDSDFPSSIEGEKIDPTEFEVVYAVIYSDRRPLHERLPFFSKLNMMYAVRALRNLGFQVSKASILRTEDVSIAV